MPRKNTRHEKKLPSIEEFDYDVDDRLVEAAQWRDKYVLKELFHLRTVNGVSIAFPQTAVFRCFQRLLNPTPPEVRLIANCFIRIGELWVDRNNASVAAWHRSSGVRDEAFRVTDRFIGALGKRLHEALKENGVARAKRIKQLSTLLGAAVEHATATKPKMHGGRELVKVPTNTFPFELVWPSQIRPCKFSGSFLEKAYGARTAEELKSLMLAHEVDETIIEAPIACVVIEYVRRWVEKNECLPTKLEARLALEKDFPDIKKTSTSTFRDIFKEAGLTSLPEAKPFTHPRNGGVVR